MTSIKSELLIDGNVLRENIVSIKKRLSEDSKFLAVIKSDAYGHNLKNIVNDIDDLVDGHAHERHSTLQSRCSSTLFRQVCRFHLN